MILGWADEFHRQKGRWPHHFDGRVSRASEDTWATVNSALAGGDRGLPGRSSLARLLFVHRGVRSPGNVPDLSESQIVKWARAHFRRFNRWPEGHSGPVVDAPEESWAAIDLALRRGKRGLPGGSSLARLLDTLGIKPNPQSRPRFTEQQVLLLADAFFVVPAGTGRIATRVPLRNYPGRTGRASTGHCNVGFVDWPLAGLWSHSWTSIGRYLAD
jgi:hypothetical protein